MSFIALGNITLNISTFFYFIWLTPQLSLTFKRKSTEGLSLAMHNLLIIGYIADLTYGFGRNLPIQYRLVTFSGLFALSIEHFQFWRYGHSQRKERVFFLFLTILFAALILLAMFFNKMNYGSREFYNFFGLVALLSWILYLWPQILNNFLSQSTQGVSRQTVLFSLVTSFLDLISAFALEWDWPSKFGTTIILFPKFIILFQYYYFNTYSLKNRLQSNAT